MLRHERDIRTQPAGAEALDTILGCWVIDFDADLVDYRQQAIAELDYEKLADGSGMTGAELEVKVNEFLEWLDAELRADTVPGKKSLQ